MANARQWIARILTATAIAVPVVAIGVYAINPFGAQSLDPRQRILGYGLYRVPSASMLPSLRVGTIVFSRVGDDRRRAPMRGDIVVYAPQQHPDQVWIKRVIGLPGERIGYHGNRVLIDGRPLSYARVGVYRGDGAEPDGVTQIELREDLPGSPHSILEVESPQSEDPGEGDWVVPPGEYFLMGDNRDRSDDSRFGGTVPRSALRGRVVGHL